MEILLISFVAFFLGAALGGAWTWKIWVQSFRGIRKRA